MSVPASFPRPAALRSASRARLLRSRGPHGAVLLSLVQDGARRRLTTTHHPNRQQPQPQLLPCGRPPHRLGAVSRNWEVEPRCTVPGLAAIRCVPLNAQRRGSGLQVLPHRSLQLWSLRVPSLQNGGARHASTSTVTNTGASGSKRSSTVDQHTPLASPPTPKAIAAHLDEYVIGQTRAKRALAVGVFSHYVRLASIERMRESHAAAAAAEEAEGAAAMQALAAQEQTDLARSATAVQSTGSPRHIKGAHTDRSASKDEPLLSDYVGQTRGSKRWNASREDSTAASCSNTGHLAPAYFSSAKWPAFATVDTHATTSKETRMPNAEASRRMQKTESSPPPRAAAPHASFEKSNILMIGPSGCGKTHLVRTLAKSLSVPFVHADATPLTSAGYVGDDVESILSRLLESAEWDVERAERGIICIDEIDKLASPSSPSSGIKLAGRDVGGTGVQQALLRILEGTVVTVPDKRASASSSGTGSTSSSSRPSRSGGASKPWWSPEMQALNAEHKSRDQPSLHKNQGATALALDNQRAGSPFAPTSSSSSNSSSTRSGAGATVADGSGSIKIDTSNILFVLCGAFVGLRDIVAARAHRASPRHVEAEDLTAYGLIPEFVGRLPVTVTLDALTEADMARILTEPRNALVTQYQNLFASFNVKLHFTQAAITAIAHQACQLSGASSGARSLRRLLETLLLDTMYDAPGGGVRYALVDRQAAMGEREVLLFSRGGRSAWMTAMEEDGAESTEAGPEVKAKGAAKKDMAVKTPDATRRTPSSARQPPQVEDSNKTGAGASSPAQQPRAGVFGRIDKAMLRRRARARLTRPSRVGNLRILTSDS